MKSPDLAALVSGEIKGQAAPRQLRWAFPRPLPPRPRGVLSHAARAVFVWPEKLEAHVADPAFIE